jgi:hypothetical protein
MFSPKAFIQEILTNNLSEWVENIEDESIHVRALVFSPTTLSLSILSLPSSSHIPPLL